MCTKGRSSPCSGAPAPARPRPCAPSPASPNRLWRTPQSAQPPTSCKSSRPSREIVALRGRNGAGKTSTLRTIARLAQPHLAHGEIWLDHQPLHEMQAFQAARVGVGLVPEDRRIIPGLTVEENLKLAQIEKPHGWAIERLFEHFPRLAERRKQEGVTLSGGEQQMLAVARTLARDVKLLLLDEPYEGLAPVIVREIEKIVEEIKALGLTTIIVGQNAIAALDRKSAGEG